MLSSYHWQFPQVCQYHWHTKGEISTHKDQHKNHTHDADLYSAFFHGTAGTVLYKYFLIFRLKTLKAQLKQIQNAYITHTWTYTKTCQQMARVHFLYACAYLEFYTVKDFV